MPPTIIAPFPTDLAPVPGITPFAQTWLDELRVSLDPPFSGGLRHPYDDRFYPLGLACELNDPDQWDGTLYQATAHFLPAEVQARLGLRTHDGHFALTPEVQSALPPELVDAALRVSALNQRVTIAGLNDTGGLDFPSIAKFVELRPPGLFAPAD